MGDLSTHDSVGSIAVIGMAGRFPKARNLDEFWENLKNGVEAISPLTDEELEESGVRPEIYNNPNYVKTAGGVLEDIELFDAAFFDYTPREAEVMDPQHRLFLECAYETLENSGYDPESYPGAIGVYAGASMNSYMLNNLFTNRALLESLGGFNLMVSNDKDFVATRVSYKLNLKGPSIVMQTACSTGLVVISEACQSLLNYQCDMALAGGVAVRAPQKVGYMYQQGGIGSPDGHCRAFDAKARGTVGGNGLGIVLLKRLSEAIEDGDTIHAVIRGSGLNNDGSLKVGYTAPSVDGQAEVIAMAHALGGITADTVGYIETHGTGTELGDPIEISALTKAFRATTDKKGFCAIGSLKTNIGHLDAAAGLGGFIKAVLSLKNKQMAPSLNFEKPNPKIDFENTPFYVNAKLTDWEEKEHPRRAGVSSFGIGGTNAHIVLEEAPDLEPTGPSRPQQLLLFSAKTKGALDRMTGKMAEHVEANPDVNFADLAYTLKIGRKGYKHRRMLVCGSLQEAAQGLSGGDAKKLVTGAHEAGNRAVAFMFPGQGAQHANMGRELYDSEPLFRQTVDECCDLVKPHLDLDLRQVLYPKEEKVDSANEQLKQTAITQPALFIIEYALAKLWMSWGIQPQAMIGHSIGEYVAACIAGVMSVEDALALVVERGRLMQQMPAGSMMAVSLSAAEVKRFLSDDITLAAVNAPNLSVVSGATTKIDELEQELSEKGIDVRRLHTSHAFHSPMMDPILAPFTKRVQEMKLSSPKIPFISNVSGTWITAEQATDANYWARHLRQGVRFSEGAEQLLQEPSRVLLEVGPGRTLNTLSGMTQIEMRKKKTVDTADQVILSSMRHPEDKQSDLGFLLNTLGRLWLAGVKIDWNGFYAGEKRRRIPLPTYPFDRQRYWVEPRKNRAAESPARVVSAGKKTDISDWFYLPVWKQTFVSKSGDTDLPGENACWLLFADKAGLGSKLAERLAAEAQTVISVTPGDGFTKSDDRHFTVDPKNADDYASLIAELAGRKITPKKIAHMWGVDGPAKDSKTMQDLGVFSLLHLARALDKQKVTDSLEITVITCNMQEVTGREELAPEKATVLGACKVIPQEYLNIRCRSIDVTLPGSNGISEDKIVDNLFIDLTRKQKDLVVAYRDNRRWVQGFDPVNVGMNEGRPMQLREQGVYLVTGGTGRIGLTLAEYLAKTCKARLVLTSRSGLPAREEWEDYLSKHEDGDATAHKIRQVQKLEKSGAEVLAVKADAGDLKQMQKAIDLATKSFGDLNGVFHAAGVLVGGKFNSIQETSPEDCQAQFHPKIDGLKVLEQVVDGKKLDFCLLFSSISSVLGGLGFLAYSSANLYMDAFTRQKNREKGTPWISVNWDAWQFAPKKKGAAGSNLADLALSPEEGMEVLERILAIEPPAQLVISTGDLQARISKWVELESVREKEKTEEVESSAKYARPELQEDYEAPTNDLETQLADIWQELFGIDKIGIRDNFFELGGHSLLATSLVSRVRDSFQVEMSLHALFEKPTIADLAEVILDKLVEQEDSDTLSQMLEEIEGES